MTGFLLSDSELHGLIDGQIEVHHRADILRRAATSAIDRERIGSWQTQCELIRAAFQGIDREPVPSLLDLRAPARLHVVAPARSIHPIGDAPPIIAEGRRKSRLLLPCLAILVAAAGLAATWLAGGFSLAPPEAASADELLARRAAGELTSRPVTAPPPSMPTATIPDLTALGFVLVAAEVQGSRPASLLFHYRNAASERITLGIARSDAAPPSGGSSRAVPLGRAMVWHVADRTYALAGNLRPERLGTLLPAVRDLAVDE